MDHFSFYGTTFPLDLLPLHPSRLPTCHADLTPTYSTRLTDLLPPPDRQAAGDGGV